MSGKPRNFIYFQYLIPDFKGNVAQDIPRQKKESENLKNLKMHSAQFGKKTLVKNSMIRLIPDL